MSLGQSKDMESLLWSWCGACTYPPQRGVTPGSRSVNSSAGSHPPSSLPATGHGLRSDPLVETKAAQRQTEASGRSDHQRKEGSEGPAHTAACVTRDHLGLRSHPRPTTPGICLFPPARAFAGLSPLPELSFSPFPTNSYLSSRR